MENNITPMRNNEIPEEYKPLLIIHRRLIDSLHYKFDENKVSIAEMTGNVLALIGAKFACEYPYCDSKENLTIHHMVQRKQRGICSDLKYIPQRHYFENQVVLCATHHAKVDKLKAESILTISNDRIEKLKNLDMKNKNPIGAIIKAKKDGKKNSRKKE